MSQVDLKEQVEKIQHFAEDHFASPIPVDFDVGQKSRLDSFQL